jgi:hypothetical protein
MYLRNRENISLTKKKKLQRKQKGGRTIRERLALLSNSISPSHIFTFRNRNRSNKVVQEPSPPTVKRTRTGTRTRTTGKKAAKAAEAAEAAEATDAEAAEIAEIAKIGRRQAQELRDTEKQNARLITAANRAFKTESVKLAQDSQQLVDEFNRALFGEDAIVNISPNSNTLSPAEEEEVLLAQLDADVTPLTQEEKALLQELEKFTKGGKKSRTHRKPKRARK